MNVAILGATGIGKYHANWFNIEGCKVKSFLGRTENSLDYASEMLKFNFGIDAKGYSHLNSLLSAEKPDLVVVSTPPELHYSMVRDALNSGANVLCEKPFVWDNNLSPYLNLAKARELIDLASEKDLILSVNTQYTYLLPLYYRLKDIAKISSSGLPKSFYFYFESKGSGSRKAGLDLWTDLAPHPLSLILAVIPEGKIDESTIKFNLKESEICVEFKYDYKDSFCLISIIYKIISEGNPKRSIGFDNFIVDYENFKDEKNKSMIKLSHKNYQIIGEDLMHSSIKNFIYSVKTKNSSVSPNQLYRNLEIQTQIYESLKKLLLH